MAFQPGPYYQAPPPKPVAKPLSRRPWLLALIGVAGLFIVLLVIGAIVGPAESESQQPVANRIAPVPSNSSSANTTAAAASSSAAAASSAAASSAAASTSAAAQASSAAAAASTAAAAASSAAAVAAAEAARVALVAACSTWNGDYLYAIANNNPSITRATQAAWELTWSLSKPATCLLTAPVNAALAAARVTASTMEDAANRPVVAPPTYSNGGASNGGGGGSGGGGSSLGNPGNSKNCSDFSTHAQAQAWFDTYYPSFGDVAGLDADNDMSACETLP